MSTKAGWQKEREAKQKQKQWESQQQQNTDHQEWQNNRSNMIKKKEEADLKAKQADESAPEFLKKLGAMREKSIKPQKKQDEGPTIEELDDGTDVPPWHRPNAPEKPEWVVLLLLAAAQEAEEEGEHELVSSGKSLKLDNLSAEEPQPEDQPEWMKQAKNLKSTPTISPENKSKPMRMSSFHSEQQGVKLKPSTPPVVAKPIQRPNSKAEASPKLSAAKLSASAALALEGEKPEWMKGADALKKKKAEGQSPTSRETSKSPLPGASEAQPAWMAQRSKIKEKAKEDESKTEKPEGEESKKNLPKSKSVEDEPIWMRQRSKIKQKAKGEHPPDDITPPSEKGGGKEEKKDKKKPEKNLPKSKSVEEEPIWMRQRSKIKQKAKEEHPPDDKPKESKEEDKPDWMKHKLKPRVSAKELQTSKVQEKLGSRKPIRQSSIKLTKEELNANIVKQKLAKRDSLVDKKAIVKSEEMEWMKAKLKPRTANKAAEVATAIKEEDDGKPAWMKHKLKPHVSVEDIKASKVQEKLEKKEPIRQPSIRLSEEELKSNVVQEKLEKKEPIRQPSIRLSKEELKSNIVQEKLKQRPSLAYKKSPIKTEEMEWMKKKLKPSNSNRNLIPKPPIADANDERPGWFKEASSRGLLDSNDGNKSDEKKLKRSSSKSPLTAKPSNSKLAHEAEGEQRPEAQKRMPSLRNLSGGSGDEPIDSSTRSEETPPVQGASPGKPETASATKLADGPVKLKSGKKVATVTPDATPKASKPQSTVPGCASAPVLEQEINPFDLFPIKGPTPKPTKKRGSSKSKDQDLRFWSSMVELCTSKDDDDSSSSDSTEMQDSAIDFTASMNDIAAVMDSPTKSKSSAPSLLLTSAERRKSRLATSSNDRTKSRSRSRGSFGSRSSQDKKKKKRESKDKRKEPKKTSKKEKSSHEKKKEKKDKKKRDSITAAAKEEKNGASQTLQPSSVSTSASTVSTASTAIPKTAETKDSKPKWWVAAKQEAKDPNWASAQAPDGRTYYYHTVTNQTTWTKPAGF